MSNRRKFLKTATSTAAAFAMGTYFHSAYSQRIKEANQSIQHLSPNQVAENEDFWFVIQQAYTVSKNLINLNNGGVSPQPLVVQQTLEHYNRYANEAPVLTMWDHLDKGREPLRRKLADLAGCSDEEIAICRNSTEALDCAIFGMNLKAGDEVVLTKQDYPNMINA